MNPWSTWQSIVGKINYHYLKSADVQVAQSDEDILAIQQMIYQVYVAERKYSFPGVDHERRVVTSPEDRAPGSRFLFTRDDKGIVSAVRINTWSRAEVPEGVAGDLSLDLLPGLEGLNITEICRLVVREDARGSPTAAGSVLLRAFEDAVQDFGSDLGFMYCVPGLVPYYLDMGFRPYGGRLVDVDFTSMIPVLIVPSDVEYLKQGGSFLAAAAERIYKDRARLDISAFASRLADDNLPVVIDKDEIMRMLVGLEEQECDFLQDLSPSDLEALARSAFAMDIDDGRVLTSKGTRETEIYLVLEGQFEIIVADKVITHLDPGSVIGEVAFFTAAQQRTATVRARGASKILVMKRSSVMRLLRSAPEAGAQVLFNLSRTLAARLIRMTERQAAAEAASPDAG